MANLGSLAALLQAALGGDGAAVNEFRRRIADIVWKACTIATADEADARTAFHEVMENLADANFARLRGYAGRGRLETYVAVVARDLLALRIVRLVREDRRRGWRAFETFFKDDLRRLVRKRVGVSSGDALDDDAYQEVCAAFVANDFRRLRSYAGQGSFTRFVLLAADRLLIDFVRATDTRRRLPEAVKRMGALEQQVFKLLAWRRMPHDAAILSPALGRVSPSREAIAEAVAAVLPHVRKSIDGEAARARDVPLPDGDQADGLVGPAGASPEDIVLARRQDEALDGALAALNRVMGTLDDRERVYLRLHLDASESLSAREVARLMMRPVQEVYKLRQSVLGKLRNILTADSAVKNWRLAVLPETEESGDHVD